jgi:hypothetical protein
MVTLYTSPECAALLVSPQFSCPQTLFPLDLRAARLIPLTSIVMLPVHYESLSEVVVVGDMMYHHRPTDSRGGREMSENLLFVRISRC